MSASTAFPIVHKLDQETLLFMRHNSTLGAFGKVAFYNPEVFAARRFAARGTRAAMRGAKTEGL